MGDEPLPFGSGPPTRNVSALEDALSLAIAERVAAFTLDDARAMPSVMRCRMLLAGIGASFVPVAMRDGTVLPDQPAILTRPDPNSTRQEFVSQTIRGLVDTGCAYWRTGDLDAEGYPRWARVLDHDEVDVRWDDRGALRLYGWRGIQLREGRGGDIVHLAINREPGELHGRGPTESGLDSLAIAWAAERYAETFYGSGGVPSVVLKLAGKSDPDEVSRVKADWMAKRVRAGITGEPAVLSSGIEAEFPGADPERSQLQQTRDYGNTVAARLYGIPGALLHVSTSGASITYSNAQAAVEELVKATLAPSYLAPIEAWWSDLVPRTQSVRFQLGELYRADVVTRWAVYRQAWEMGVLTSAQIARLEGTASVNAALQPVPAPAVAGQLPPVAMPWA